MCTALHALNLRLHPPHSYEVIGDGRSHTIELLLDHKRLTLRVDGGQTRSIVNDGAQQYMRVNAPLYVGGLPREVGVNAYSQWHLRDIASFGGTRRAGWQ